MITDEKKCEEERKLTYRDQLRYTDMRYVDSFVYVIPYQYE